MSAYIHPIAGAAVLALLGYAALLGFRAGTAKRGRSALLARHSRLAPISYVLVLASWAGGVASTFWLRTDLELAGTLHFRIGTAMALLMTASALSSRAMRRGHPGARELHPWLGAAAVLLAAAHWVAGLQITP